MGTQQQAPLSWFAAPEVGLAPAADQGAFGLDAGGATDFEELLAQKAEELSGLAAAGNAFVAEALNKRQGAAEAFASVDQGAFAADGVGVSSALADAYLALADFQAADDGSVGWSSELQDAREARDAVAEDASSVDDDLLVDIDAHLGLAFAERLTGTGPERIDAAVKVGSLHLDGGADLRAVGDALGGVTDEQAMHAADTLARDYRDGAKEAGTEAFYNDRLAESGATDALKGYFAYAMGLPDSPYYREYDENGVASLTGAGVLDQIRDAQAAADAAVRSATQDFGRMTKPLDGSLAKRGGLLTELLVPGPGDKAKLAVEIEIPVTTVGLAQTEVALSFESEVENADGQYKLSTKVGVGLEAELDVGLAELELAVGGLGTLEARGDSGDEAFGLMLYGLADGVESVSETAHDLVFGGMDKAAIEEGMDEDDYAERALGWYAGASLERETVDGEEEGVSARYENLYGDRLVKGEDGAMRRASYEDHVLSGAIALDGGGGEGKVRLREGAKGLESVNAEAKVSLEVPAELMQATLSNGELVQGAAQQLGEIVISAMGLAGEPSGTGQVVKDLGRIGRIAGLDRQLLAKADDALSIDSLGGASQSYVLGVALEGTPKSMAADVTLEEVNAIEAEYDAGVETDVRAESSRLVAKVKLA